MTWLASLPWPLLLFGGLTVVSFALWLICVFMDRRARRTLAHVALAISDTEKKEATYET